MRFAELGLAVSLVLTVAVLAAAAVLAALAPRRGWPPPARRTAWFGAGCATAALLVQAWLVGRVAMVGDPPGLDLALLRWSVQHRESWAIGLGRVLALIGGPGAMAVLAALAATVCWAKGRRTPVVVLAGTGAAAVAMTHGFKALYDRARPPLADQIIPYTTNALPSGHALGSMVVVGTLAAVVVAASSSRGARVGTLLGAGTFVSAVGVSRVYLAAHWVTDVLVGWLLGAAVVAVGATALALTLGVAPAQSVSSRTSQTTTPPRS
ncbi:MAG: phosphatase PAP2 family protein [Pseudonocardia sp.]|jgi:membrane-associated phospholipid phosphatase